MNLFFRHKRERRRAVGVYIYFKPRKIPYPSRQYLVLPLPSARYYRIEGLRYIPIPLGITEGKVAVVGSRFQSALYPLVFNISSGVCYRLARPLSFRVAHLGSSIQPKIDSFSLN